MATDPEIIRRLRNLEHRLERIETLDKPYATYAGWTPTLTGSTGNPTLTYTTQTGVYQRSSQAILIAFAIILSAASGGSGTLRLAGLPLAVGPSQSQRGGIALTYTTGWAGTPPTSVIPEASQVYGTFFVASTGTALTTADLTASTAVYGFGVYFMA